MNQYVKQSTFKKHIDILLTKINLALKENKEYKANFWSVIIFDTSGFLIFLIFFTYYSQLINNILPWDFLDYILYFLICLLSGKAIWAFALMYFDDYLLRGNLNTLLTKPVNIYFYSSLRKLNGATIPTAIVVFFAIIIISIFGNYTNKFLSILIWTFGTLYYLFFVNFFNSVAFFIKRNEFLVNSLQTINWNNEEYTPVVFENSFLKWLFFLLPSALYGYFTIESLKGNIQTFISYLLYMLLTFVILSIGTYLLWHFGLKKYEAFG